MRSPMKFYILAITALVIQVTEAIKSNVPPMYQALVEKKQAESLALVQNGTTATPTESPFQINSTRTGIPSIYEKEFLSITKPKNGSKSLGKYRSPFRKVDESYFQKPFKRINLSENRHSVTSSPLIERDDELSLQNLSGSEDKQFSTEVPKEPPTIPSGTSEVPMDLPQNLNSISNQESQKQIGTTTPKPFDYNLSKGSKPYKKITHENAQNNFIDDSNSMKTSYNFKRSLKPSKFDEDGEGMDEFIKTKSKKKLKLKITQKKMGEKQGNKFSDLKYIGFPYIIKDHKMKSASKMVKDKPQSLNYNSFNTFAKKRREKKVPPKLAEFRKSLIEHQKFKHLPEYMAKIHGHVPFGKVNKTKISPTSLAKRKDFGIRDRKSKMMKDIARNGEENSKLRKKQILEKHGGTSKVDKPVALTSEININDPFQYAKLLG